MAQMLLQIKAIRLQPKAPFTWASGMQSPIYCDNRVILSHVESRDMLRDHMTTLIKEAFDGVEVIAGVATGGIALAALVAQALDLPMIYIRSKAKGHGRQNLIEGHMEQGAKVVVIEDLVSTGMSSLLAVDALVEADAEVMGMASIFTYGFAQSAQAMKAANVNLHCLCDYDHLLESAVEGSAIDAEDLDALAAWRHDPQAWSDRQG